MKRYIFSVLLGIMLGLFLVIVKFVIGNLTYIIGIVLAVAFTIISHKIKWENIDNKVIYFI